MRTDVDEGLKGEVEEGVTRALRFVLMLSSMRLRDSRRKDRSDECEKQNCGVRFDCGVGGRDIISAGAGAGFVRGEGASLRRGDRAPLSTVEEGEGLGGESGVFQNHASLKVRDGLGDTVETEAPGGLGQCAVLQTA